MPTSQTTPYLPHSSFPSEPKRVLTGLLIAADPLPAGTFFLRLLFVLAISHLFLDVGLDVQQCLAARVADCTGNVTDRTQSLGEDLSDRVSDGGEQTFVKIS